MEDLGLSSQHAGFLGFVIRGKTRDEHSFLQVAQGDLANEFQEGLLEGFV